MKVLIHKKKFSGGPAVFRTRLTKAMKRNGEVQVVDDPQKGFHCEISFIRFLSQHNKPRIIRIDGCYFKNSQLSQNRDLLKSLKSSHSVIYQSKFSKKMCEDIMGYTHPKSNVIYNGIDLNKVNKVEADPDIEPGSFVTVAKWRDNKRPHSTIKGFLEADTGRKLYVIGGDYPKEYKKEKNIVFLGEIQDEEVIFSKLKACSYMMHLCYIDSCPNAVIEGLSCGLNVLCTNLGGTPELVGENGYIMNIDDWNNSPQKDRKLDRVNTKVIADGIHKVMKITDRPVRNDLSVDDVAKKYIEVVKNTMEQK